MGIFWVPAFHGGTPSLMCMQMWDGCGIIISQTLYLFISYFIHGLQGSALHTKHTRGKVGDTASNSGTQLQSSIEQFNCDSRAIRYSKAIKTHETILHEGENLKFSPILNPKGGRVCIKKIKKRRTQ